MNKINVLKMELEDMILENKPYNEIVKKSKELDYYITKEMININKKEIKI